MPAVRNEVASPRSSGNDVIEAKLLTAVVAVDNGDWIDVRHYKDFSFHVKGITTAVVKIHGSNDDTKPVAGDHEDQIGTDFSADGIQQAAGVYKWVKARVSSWTSGTISVYMLGHGNN